MAALNWRAWLPEKPLTTWQGLLVGLGAGAAGVAVRAVLPTAVSRDAQLVVFIPFVALGATFGGLPGGLAALLVAIAGGAILSPDAGLWPLTDLCVAGALVVGLIAAFGQIIRDLRRSEASLATAKAQVETIARELDHRGRNSLFVIMSIVSQSASGAGSAAEAAQIINGRLEAMLRAQDLLVQSESGVIGLKALLERALQPFGMARFDIGVASEVSMATDVGVGLALVFHELATNALKHGALAAPRGRISIDWIASGDVVRLSWREKGGPEVRQPLKRGFGSRLFEVALVPQGGRAERRFEPTGLVCDLTIPAPANPPRFLSSIPSGSAFAQGRSGATAHPLEGSI
jgi:two-component sensor histidine kinase